MRTSSGPGLHMLDPTACRGLLARGGTGRIVFTRRALPDARPVAFVEDHGLITFAVDDPDVAAAVSANAVAAFEADGHDLVSGTAWTVLAVGATSEIVSPTALARIRRRLTGPWATADDTRVLALSPQQLSGSRRVPPAAPATSVAAS